MKKHKNKIIACAIIAFILAIAFLYGGNIPKSNIQPTEQPKIVDDNTTEESVKKENSVLNEEKQRLRRLK